MDLRFIFNESSETPSFPPFQKLPTELRHPIWRMACAPRIVHIYRRKLQSSDDRQFFAQYLAQIQTQKFSDPQQLMQAMAGASTRRAAASVGVQSDCTTPDIIFTCREALEACNYAPSFLGQMSIPEVYFNYDIDTLLISLETVDEDSTFPTGSFFKLGLFLSQTGPAAPFIDVKYLALALPLEGVAGCEKWVFNLLYAFPNVEVLTFVAGVDQSWTYSRELEYDFLDLERPAEISDRPLQDFSSRMEVPNINSYMDIKVLQDLYADAKREDPELSLKLPRFEIKQIVPK